MFYVKKYMSFWPIKDNLQFCFNVNINYYFFNEDVFFKRCIVLLLCLSIMHTFKKKVKLLPFETTTAVCNNVFNI